MAKQVFEFSEYKSFILEIVSTHGGRGLRSRMSEAMRVRTAYLSQVLGGKAHLSQEQAHSLVAYLGLNRDECHYFMLLLLRGRAGTLALKKYYDEQMHEVHKRRLELKERLEIKRTLSAVDQGLYYSAWYFCAIHVLVSLPAYRRKESIAAALRLPVEKVAEVLEDLRTMGIITQKGDQFSVSATGIHLPHDSPFISRHHTNWKMQAIASLDKGTDLGTHYSSVISLQKQDVPKVRAILVNAIEQIRSVVKTSKDEVAYCYLLDLFPVVE